MDKSEYSSEWIAGIGYHIGINVGDIDEGLRFYRDVLGFEESWRYTVGGEFLESLSGVDGAQADVIQLMCPGGSRIEIMEYSPRGNQSAVRQNDVGLNHLSFGVADVAAAHKRLSEAGVEFACDAIEILDEDHPLFGWVVTYFSDPWGTSLELLGPCSSRDIDVGERPAARQRGSDQALGSVRPG